MFSLLQPIFFLGFPWFRHLVAPWGRVLTERRRGKAGDGGQRTAGGQLVDPATWQPWEHRVVAEVFGCGSSSAKK